MDQRPRAPSATEVSGFWAQPPLGRLTTPELLGIHDDPATTPDDLAQLSPEERSRLEAALASRQPQEKCLGGFLQNVGTSAVDQLKGLAEWAPLAGHFVANPTATVGAMQQALPQLRGALATGLSGRYGGWENIKNTAYEDPIGMLADATVLTGPGAITLAY